MCLLISVSWFPVNSQDGHTVHPASVQRHHTVPRYSWRNCWHSSQFRVHIFQVRFLLLDFNARLSTPLCVLRWRSDALPLWMERLRHCCLLFLYRHHLPCCRAGVSPRCKYPEERWLKRKAEKHSIHLFRDKRKFEVCFSSSVSF